MILRQHVQVTRVWTRVVHCPSEEVLQISGIFADSSDILKGLFGWSSVYTLLIFWSHLRIAVCVGHPPLVDFEIWLNPTKSLNCAAYSFSFRCRPIRVDWSTGSCRFATTRRYMILTFLLFTGFTIQGWICHGGSHSSSIWHWLRFYWLTLTWSDLKSDLQSLWQRCSATQSLTTLVRFLLWWLSDVSPNALGEQSKRVTRPKAESPTHCQH